MWEFNCKLKKRFYQSWNSIPIHIYTHTTKAYAKNQEPFVLLSDLYCEVVIDRKSKSTASWSGRTVSGLHTVELLQVGTNAEIIV